MHVWFLVEIVGGTKEGGRGGGARGRISLLIGSIFWCSPGVTFFPNLMLICYIVGCLVQMALLLFLCLPSRYFFLLLSLL